VVDNPGGGDALLLVNCYDGVSHCLRAGDGTVVWRHETPEVKRPNF
jgi:outer membrane protein assembly factor BamB